jgi:hypothetical protein
MPKKRKKSKKKATLSPSLFKVTGASAKLKVDDKKKKLYYFGTKVKPKKAAKLAAGTGADILGVSGTALNVSKPALKYDFYCNYEADLKMAFVRVRKQEFGVQDQMKAAMVGKEIHTPKKGKGIPGKAIQLDIVELFETKGTDTMLLDGSTGTPARSLERLLKGPGKKKASSAWVRKNKISPGKFNTLEKVTKAVVKMASRKPAEAKRVVSHNLTFKKLEGYYVPTYYVKVSAGSESKMMRINAVNGNVALKV